jgi:hypothetical protein
LLVAYSQQKNRWAESFAAGWLQSLDIEEDGVRVLWIQAKMGNLHLKITEIGIRLFKNRLGSARQEGDAGVLWWWILLQP